MNKYLKALVILSSCSSVLVACQRSSNDAEDNQAAVLLSDINRDITQPRFEFVVTNQALKNASIDDEAWGKLMNCEDASTRERLDKEIYSVSYDLIKRSQGSDMSLSGEGERAKDAKFIDVAGMTYQTSDSGINYTKSFTQKVLRYGDQDFLEEGPYSYSDSCTSDGCSDKSRTYTPEDGALYAVKAKTKMSRTMVRSALLESDAIFCSFKKLDESGDPEVTVEEGEVSIAGTVYKAVRRTTITKGKMDCHDGLNSEGKKHNVGPAQSIEILVVLADSLPSSVEQSGFDSGLGQSCSRTAIFKANKSFLNSDASISYGSSYEIGDFQLTGDVTPLEQWEDKQTELSATLGALVEAVDDAKLHLANMESQEAEALAKKNAAEAEAERANLAATKAQVESDLRKRYSETAEEYQKRVNDELSKREDEQRVAQRASELDVRNYNAAAEATQTAKKIVLDAEVALERHRRKMGS